MLLAKVVLVGAEPAAAAIHLVLGGIVDERIVYDDRVVGTVVTVQRTTGLDVRVAVADVDADVISLEIIAEDLIVIPVNPDAAGIFDVVSVIEIVVAVALADLAAAGAIEQGVITIGVAAGFVRNHLVLTAAPQEQVVFNDAKTIREADTAQAKANVLLAVSADG